MNGLSIEELITKAREEKVRIEVEIAPDEYGHVTQRITIEPWQPIEYLCPHQVGIKRGDSDELEAEVKAYKDILNGVKEQPTIPHDMKWNPDCEDCRPEDIRECILCRQR